MYVEHPNETPKLTSLFFLDILRPITAYFGENMPSNGIPLEDLQAINVTESASALILQPDGKACIGGVLPEGIYVRRRLFRASIRHGHEGDNQR